MIDTYLVFAGLVSVLVDTANLPGSDPHLRGECIPLHSAADRSIFATCGFDCRRGQLGSNRKPIVQPGIRWNGIVAFQLGGAQERQLRVYRFLERRPRCHCHGTYQIIAVRDV